AEDEARGHRRPDPEERPGLAHRARPITANSFVVWLLRRHSRVREPAETITAPPREASRRADAPRCRLRCRERFFVLDLGRRRRLRRRHLEPLLLAPAQDVVAVDAV